jgi:ribosomal protein S18 acetylase RimI-like enzyme
VPDLTFRRYDTAGALAVRDTVAQVHRGAYAARINSGDPFSTVDAFMQRFDAYTSRDGFDLVIACLDGNPVGQAWGWPLDQARGAGWWEGVVQEPEPGFTVEDGKRTFALSEIMVRQEYTGQHIAHALHNELLSGRPETRATLLVNPANESAYRIYVRWGWRKVAQVRPRWPDAPLFDVLILPLPIGR